MNILVCIKQIAELNIAGILSSQTRLDIPTDTRFRMNRFDEYAIESAVILKEQIEDCTIDVVTVGPESADNILKRAMGMGADNAIRIDINPKNYYSPFSISNLLSKIPRIRSYDLILTGIMSEDEMNAQTGQMLAAQLNMPSVTGVVAIDLNINKLYVEREREGGTKEQLIVLMPALLTIQAGINQPRYPSLSALLRAKKKDIQIIQIDNNDMDNDQSIMRICPAEKNRKGKTLTGSISQKAREFIEILNEKGVL
jgi:electron transfer flavoprotein beta subunit